MSFAQFRAKDLQKSSAENWNLQHVAHPQACASLLSLLKHSLVQKVNGSPINQPQSTLKHPNNLFIQMICSSVSDEVRVPFVVRCHFIDVAGGVSSCSLVTLCFPSLPRIIIPGLSEASRLPLCMFDRALPGPFIMQGVKFPPSIWKFLQGQGCVINFYRGNDSEKVGQPEVAWKQFLQN